MAKTSAIGYIAAARQRLTASPDNTGLGQPRTSSGGPPETYDGLPAGLNFRFLSAPRASAEFTLNRFREGGGGRDVTLSLKEGVAHNVEFPVFARPVVAGFMFQAAAGPANHDGATFGTAGDTAGGGQMANGLVKPPLLSVGGGNSNLTNPQSAGDATIIVDTIGTFADTELIVVGLGGNMEFHTIMGAPSGTTITLTTPLLYSHAKGERVYEVDAYTNISAAEPAGETMLTVADEMTFGDMDDIAIVGIGSVAANGGQEYGQAEEATIMGAPSANTIVIASATEHAHSIGSWVYIVDPTANYVHFFEPVSSLAGSTDYFSVDRTVGADINERVQDGKLAQFELTAESPAAVRFNSSWICRFGAIRTALLAEDYTNQDPAADLPFRMPDGGFLFDFGGEIGVSTKLRQISAQFTNIVADDIFTDEISRDEILDLARESAISAQFYFIDEKEYYQVVYGTSAPTGGETPVTSSTFGEVVLNWDIGGTDLMSIWYPQVEWGNFPSEIDPEPRPIIVEASGQPLKKATQPLWVATVQNKTGVLY